MKVKKVVGLGVALTCCFSLQLLDNPLAKLADSGLSQKTTPLLAQKTLANSAPLLVAIRREGGLCQRMGCFSEVAILSDGTYRYTTHQSRPVTGRIATSDLQQLQTQIKNTNFDLLRSQRTIANPLPDLCLLPVDGPEAIYRFSMNNRIEEIRGCQTQIDANNLLFKQLEQLYQQISEQASQEAAIAPSPLPKATTEPIVQVTSLETPLNADRSTTFLSDSDRKTLGSLPLNLANTVMDDAYEWFATGEIFSNSDPKTGVDVEFQLDSVRSIAWNECQGNGGPSRPAMGICPDVTRSGWRMVVRGGPKQNPFRLVYYIPRDANANSFIPKPDGLQSLLNSVQTKILQTISQQIEVPLSEIRLHWAETQRFDRCLNVKSQEIRCQGEIRPGWRIEVFANSPLFKTPGEETLWVYHANLTGSEVHSISRGAWSPPPVVHPPAS